jgi:hypothetical protein
MKKHWLRGVLLGVSLALLLAGGVALARGVYVTVDQPCFECWQQPVPVDAGPTLFVPEEYVVELTLGGWSPSCEEVAWHISDPVDEYWAKGGDTPSHLQEPCHLWLWVECDGLMGYWWDDCAAQPVAPANGIPGHYGQWVATINQYEPDVQAQVSIRFAETCEEEFVPEPGTMLLLGSGLAGLAGYATLRLRSGQALRWRTRQ